MGNSDNLLLVIVLLLIYAFLDLLVIFPLLLPLINQTGGNIFYPFFGIAITGEFASLILVATGGHVRGNH